MSMMKSRSFRPSDVDPSARAYRPTDDGKPKSGPIDVGGGPKIKPPPRSPKKGDKKKK
jgi:hypothetical protein